MIRATLPQVPGPNSSTRRHEAPTTQCFPLTPSRSPNRTSTTSPVSANHLVPVPSEDLDTPGETSTLTEIDEDELPPSISQPRVPAIHVDTGAGPSLIPPSETSRTLRKQRSVERTRTWAEEVERRRRKAEMVVKKNREDRERMMHLENSGDNFWSCSSQVFDSMLEELDPERQTHSIDSSRSIPIFSSNYEKKSSQAERRSRKGTSSIDPIAKPSVSTRPSTTHSPESPATSAKVPIMSIEEIVRRHSGALSQAETSAREKARLQIARDSPLPAATIDASTKTSSKHEFETLQSPRVPISPIIIDRRSSTPATSNLRACSPTVSSEDESPTSSDILQTARLGQAWLNRLESRSMDSTRSSGASKVSVTIISERVATPVTENHQPEATTNTGKVLDQSQELALYLRSPHLNRFLDLPRPFPKRPLHVSYSEVGAPEGYPVLVFLGLGCVRYLTALFDEITTVFNLRLICIDRWGFGRTDQVSEDTRTCAEWAKVVSKILDELSIDKCQIIAHSAGAPYAGAVALRLGSRVKGRLHFLAPWINADIDGGYKWLKYIPNGLIKGALAAEWQLQSYMLGKAPRVSYVPVENPVRSPSPSLGRRTSLLLRRSSTKSLSPKPAPTGGLGRSPRLGNIRSFQHRSYSVNSVSRRSSYIGDQTPSSTSTELPSPLTPILGDGQFLTDDFGLGEGFDSFGTSLGLALPPAVPSKHVLNPISKPPMTPALTQALMQASHAESEPGTTSDLLSIVLNRPARSLGFSYSDLVHPAVVWYGSEDERVGEKGMRWLERSLTAGCELRIKEGESHNLMTSSQVMWEVFESVAREARGIA